MVGPIYRVTETGRRAWETKDVSVPLDYRTILWVMDFQGPDHLQCLIQLFPQHLLEDCLAEMEELRLIELVPLPDGSARTPSIQSRPPVSVLSIAQTELPDAREALGKHGAFVSAERVRSRQTTRKLPADTTVLVVEDDPDELALAELRVSMSGYAVQVATSQSAMLKTMAQKGKPDLLLLDVMLPDGNGLNILRNFRKLDSFASMPIVLLTAKAEPADIIEGLRLGADGYVTKPYSKNILATVIARVISN